MARLKTDFSRFFELSMDPCAVLGPQGRFEAANGAWKTTLGLDPDALSGADFLDSLHPEDRDLAGKELAAARSGSPERGFECRVVCGDRSVKRVFWQARAFEGTDALYLVGQDVTHRRRQEEALRRSEEQLRQSQKMEAIGRLAGGVAHDFNNMLTAIAGYGDLVLSSLEADDPRRDDVQEIRKTVDRATNLTRQLLAFSRRQRLTLRSVDLNAVVADMERMLRRLIGEDIELRTFPAPGLGRILADPGQIEQVILNLAVNARDAMTGGGKLTIETSAVELDDGYASAHMGVAPGRYALVAVTDTGHGMDAETLAQVFEPFFTTKGGGKGTGLGLSTVYGIVRQSGGHVAAYSEVGRGTTFKVYLPVSSEGEGASAATSAPAAPSGGTETVLLVEDDPAVRALSRRVLAMSGYQVLEARDAQEALEMSRSYEGTVHILVTDVVLPGWNGPELARRLAEARPGLKLLFLSGYADRAVVENGLLPQGAPFLQKPFPPGELARRVRESLDG